MSDEPAAHAGARYRVATTVALVAYWIVIFTATHVPKIPRELETPLSDKWQHYVAYALLGVLLTAWWTARRPLTWRAAAMLWGVMIAYGAFDESTQPLFGRDAELLDWRADIIGAATGVAVYALIRRLRGRRT